MNAFAWDANRTASAQALFAGSSPTGGISKLFRQWDVAIHGGGFRVSDQCLGRTTRVRRRADAARSATGVMGIVLGESS